MDSAGAFHYHLEWYRIPGQLIALILRHYGIRICPEIEYPSGRDRGNGPDGGLRG